MRKALLLTFLAAVLAAGQHWEFEQVDAAGWGDRVISVVHPDGMLYLCYSHDSTGEIRLARRDSTWHYEDVPTQLPPDIGTVDFAVGPAGEPGVLYVTDGGVRVVLRDTSGWVEDSVPAWSRGGNAKVTFDSQGAVAVGAVFWHADGGEGVHILRRQGNVWTADTVDSEGFSSLFACRDVGTTRDGRLWMMYSYFWEILEEDFSGLEHMVAVREDTGWVRDHTVHVGYRGFSGDAAATDSTDTLRWCVWSYDPEIGPGFVYSDDRIDWTETNNSSLAFDSLNRPVIARAFESSLVLTFRDGGRWVRRTVLDSVVEDVGLVMNSNGDPVVAYRVESGLWIATGIDVLGTAEQEPVAVERPPIPTVMRESEIRALGTELRDATGRLVNPDAGRLSPGVYFLRPEGPRYQGVKGPRVRKVILTR